MAISRLNLIFGLLCALHISQIHAVAQISNVAIDTRNIWLANTFAIKNTAIRERPLYQPDYKVFKEIYPTNVNGFAICQEILPKLENKWYVKIDFWHLSDETISLPNYLPLHVLEQLNENSVLYLQTSDNKIIKLTVQQNSHRLKIFSYKAVLRILNINKTNNHNISVLNEESIEKNNTEENLQDEIKNENNLSSSSFLSKSMLITTLGFCATAGIILYLSFPDFKTIYNEVSNFFSYKETSFK